MLSIIVLNCNRRELTKKTIQNLLSKTTVAHELILVDNDSIDGTREYLSKVSGNAKTIKITTVFNNRNLGVAGGRNSGLKVATGKYLMTIDDDIIVPDNYDIQLIDACDKIDNVGIVGVCVEPNKKKYHYPIVVLNEVSVRIKKGNIGGGCMCMSRDVFNTIGYFSADFIYGIEDVDICMRAERVGLINVYVKNRGEHIDKNNNKQYVALKKRVHHQKSKAFQKIGTKWKKYKRQFKSTGRVYVPYNEPKADSLLHDKIIRSKTNGK